MTSEVPADRSAPFLPRWATHTLVLLGSLLGCGTVDPSRPADAAGDGAADIQPAEAGVDGSGPVDSQGDTPDAGPAPDGDTSDAPGTPSFMPLREGNWWEYEVRAPGQAPFVKKQVVEAPEPVGGRGPMATELAFRLVTTKPGGNLGLPDRTVSWQRNEGPKVVRLREIGYVAGSNTINSEEYWTPYKLRVDGGLGGGPLVVGQRWEERYTEHKVSPSTGAVTSATHLDTWTVTGVAMSVTVPAGRFTDCLQLTRTDGSGAEVGKSYVFCPGVGKVREVGRAGLSQSEELTRYHLGP